MVAFMIVAVTDGGPFFWLGPGARGGERRKREEFEGGGGRRILR